MTCFVYSPKRDNEAIPLGVVIESCDSGRVVEEIRGQAGRVGRPVELMSAEEWGSRRGGSDVHVWILSLEQATPDALRDKLRFAATQSVRSIVVTGALTPEHKLAVREVSKEHPGITIQADEGCLPSLLGLQSYNSVLDPMYFTAVELDDNKSPRRLLFPILSPVDVRKMCSRLFPEPEYDLSMVTPNLDGCITDSREVLALVARFRMRPEDLAGLGHAHLAVTETMAVTWADQNLNALELSLSLASQRILIELIHAFGGNFCSRREICEWVSVTELDGMLSGHLNRNVSNDALLNYTFRSVLRDVQKQKREQEDP